MNLTRMKIKPGHSSASESPQTSAATALPTRGLTRRHLCELFVFCVAALVAVVASAQSPAKPGDKQMETVTLQTRDGLELRAYYFPSDKGKEAVPVMLVHEWDGQGAPYIGLVTALQKAGCAVLVPEYRGHGGSKFYTDARGEKKPFKTSRMSKSDVGRIIGNDLEAAKKFLKEKNNASELNLNALVVLGVGEGAIFGAHWTVSDWKFPSIGSIKQGQDVKAIIFVSPEKNFKGVGIDTVLREPYLLQLPMMIVDGAGSSSAADSKQIAKRIEPIKKRAGDDLAKVLEAKMAPTTLGGAALLKEIKAVTPLIVSFVTDNVDGASKRNMWVDRK